MKKNIVVMLASYPGKAKTALGKEVGKMAAKLEEAMQRDIAQHLSKAADFDLAVCVDPKDQSKQLQKLLKIGKAYGQRSGSRGDKLSNCLEQAFKEYKNVVVINANVPAIKQSLIKKAFAMLLSRDIVLGRDFEGNFYLVGMKEMHDVFDNVDWKSNSILKQMIKNIDSKKLSYGLLPAVPQIGSAKDIIYFRKSVDRKDCENTCSLILKMKK